MSFRPILCVALLVIAAPAYGGPDSDNPLFTPFNQIMPLDKLDSAAIDQATTQIMSRTREDLAKVCAIPKAQRTFDNTLLALDNIQNELSKVNSLIYLMNSVHPDEATRNQASASLAVLDKFDNALALDEESYRAVKEYAQTEEAKGLSGYRKKFCDETLRDFERNGFALSKGQRDQLKAIQDSIADVSIAFGNHIAADQDYLVVGEKDMDGLPDDYKKTRRQEDGSYRIDLSYPSYSGFMKSSTSDSARKALYIKYNNRAASDNVGLLSALLRYRQRMARLLGYKTYAAYRVEDRMAKTTKAVWDFETALTEKVRQKAQKDYAELLDVKRRTRNDPTAATVYPWEASFYNNLLLKEKYQLDQEVVKQYFELNHVMDGLFRVAQTLFHVTFVAIPDPAVWHPDVRAYEVRQGDAVIGRFYLDLYPRANKFTHAACYSMIRGKATVNGYQIPTATLVCNFPKPTDTQPALMYHALGSASVETFFHEFGHVLHNMLTTSPLYSFAGTSVSRDFVEAPSQIFENWVWNYDALKLFARHYRTNEVLPKDLYDKMVAARNVGSGLATLQQIFYGTFDFTLHDRFDPEGRESTTEVAARLQNQITLYPYLDGTHFQAAFGHLVGYAAGYYGYLWSRVYAQDMFSVFEKNGIMDEATGKRYRDIILAKGATEDPLDLVTEFLGRKPNQDAFLKSLGL